jgi:hypothetical protein
MKKLHLTLVSFLIFFLLSIVTIYAQDDSFGCGTEIPDSPQNRLTYLNSTTYSGSTDPAYLASFPPISFDIYFWIVNRTDGSNAYTVSYQTILENMKRINDLYRPMGICFVLKGYDFINNTNYYQNASYSQIPYYVPNCFNVYVPNTLSAGNGATSLGFNKLGVRMERFISIWQFRAGDVLAHELAHDFYLYHPWGDDNNALDTLEHVTRDPLNPNYNALTIADFIADTPAMASFYAEAGSNGIDTVVNIDDCNYIGTNQDNLGVPFELTPTDVGNVMSYTYGSCIDKFTTGQGIRIREWIADPANAGRLSLSAKRTNTRNVDLYIKDSAEDFGEEPNVVSPFTWSSPDIWVRHQQDYNPEHQNPEYHPTQPNYIHIKIGNKGCGTSSGTDQLKVYWSKAATSLGWDFHWVGNTFVNGASMGDLIGTFTIPPIESNKEIVLAVPWIVPNGVDYQDINSDPWHFCLLSRIISNDDPMTFPEIEWLGVNVPNNNNIAQKNVTVVDIDTATLGDPIGGVVAVGNVFSEIKTYSLNLIPDSKEIGKKIFEEAEVSIKLDETLMRAWSDGGKIGNDIRLVSDNKIIVTGHNARLDNIRFNPNEIGTLNLEFNFLIKEITSKDHFTYHVIQKENLTEKIIGGETYEIYKHTRNLFYADAGGDKLTDKNMPITLSAEDINEPALYNWYDNSGNLVYEGLNFVVSVEAGKKYKLEVIALSDGYKDYSEIEVNLKPNTISGILPNPTNNHSIFNYKINQGDSAYLSINPLYTSNGISQNYILDITQSEITIDFNNYPEGVYLVSLITNGQISDTKYIVKQ